MKIRRILSALLLAAMASTVGWAQSPKREIRSTWLTTVWAIDWPSSTNQTRAKSQMTHYLDNLAKHNFTGVCFQVRGMADAMYRSSYEPWSSAISGTRGKDPGWDPLEWVVEECHKRGMECYAWVNPYRESSNGKVYNTDFDREWQEKGWLLQYGDRIVFNPALPEARAHIMRVIREIYTNYKIDGILFDDYFYPDGIPQNSSADDYQLYKQSGTTMSIGDWRRDNVNRFMKEIYDNIQVDRPDMRFGISPAGVAGTSAPSYGLPGVPVPSGDWQYNTIFSDPVAWLADGAVDFISPQLYWKTTHATAPFEPLTKWWSLVSEHFGRHFYASHSISMLDSDNSTANWADVAKQVNLHRSSCTNETQGSIYYSTKYIDGTNPGQGTRGLGDYLEANVYQNKSLVPVIDWKECPVYSAPANARRSGTNLTWDAVKGVRDNSIIRYSVYAIPSSVAIENAMAADGDGIKGEYLAGVSYSTSFAIPADKTSRHYYAVCVYDGYGNESEPALIGYSTKPSEATTLLTPANGAKADINATFSWKPVANAVYDLEIAADADFAHVVISKTGLTTTEYVADLAALRGNTTYYWRVTTTQPDCQGKQSEVFTFVTDSRPTGNYEEGYTIMKDPHDYNSGGTPGYELVNLWMRSVKDGFENFPTEENGLRQRGMVVKDGYVYLSGRSAQSSTADLFLSAYNINTGEHEFDLPLSEDGRTGYLPCNDLLKDNAGNVCISNLTLNIATQPLLIHLVDLNDGKLTEVASISAKDPGRVDHCAVWGDVKKGDFYVFAAVASSNIAYRWHIKDGAVDETKTLTVTTTYPLGTDNFGIAPRVLPISETQFYIDGGSTAPTLYDITTGKALDWPGATAETAVTNTSSNGMKNFSISTHKYLVYVASSHENNGFTFNISWGQGETPLKTGIKLFNFPEATLGNVNSTTFSAPVDAVESSNGYRIYIYVPGNGLAAYAFNKLSDGVTDVTADVESMRIIGRSVRFNAPVEFISAFDLTGRKVANATNATTLTLPSAGIYLIVTPDGAKKVKIR